MLQMSEQKNLMLF